MKNKLISFILSLTLVFANFTFPITNNDNDKTNVSAAENDKWTLVWSDEFEGTSLNRNYWNVEVNGYGGWNNELQYYCDRPENIQVSDGTLKLIARKESYEGKEYTSARINTQNKVTVHHGRIEARIKLPCFMGNFPAFWMMGSNGLTWPACGEIDIMEAINNESIIYGTAHWACDYTNNAEGYDSNGSSTYEIGHTLDITEWHTYGIEWTENKITWFVDDVYYHSIDITSEKQMEELAIRHYFLLNLAVGGDWPGFVVDETALPATMEVDYVRAYEVNDNYVEPPTEIVVEDLVASHTGSWTTNVGTWASASGTMTSSTPSGGFTANLNAIGTDMWAVSSMLSNLNYTAGNTYKFKCTLQSDVNKSVFVKVEGDNASELAATYINLTAGVPYTYETDVFISNSYTGSLSLYFAFGGGCNGESLESTSALNLSVRDVSFATEKSVVVETTEAITETPTETTTVYIPETTTPEPTEIPTEGPTAADGQIKIDLVETYTGSWNYTIGSWANAAGAFTSTSNASEGFVANLSAVGNNEWGAQASLSNLSYTSGTEYIFSCVLNSSIDKNVFIKVEGDNNAEIVPAEYISLKAGQPYSYYKTVLVPSDYTGNLSLFFAYGGGANSEVISETTALDLTVTDVSFYTFKDVESGTTEEITDEIITDEVTTPPSEEVGPIVPFGVVITPGINSFELVMGNPLNGQTYNLYIDSVYHSNLVLGAHNITNIPEGTHNIKLTGYLNGIESEGYETTIVVEGNGESTTKEVEEESTPIYEETTDHETESTTELVKSEPKIDIYGLQISAKTGGFRTIYTIEDNNNSVVSSGLVYGLYTINEDELLVGSSNSTVYSYASTNKGIISLADATGVSYAMTMKFINNTEFYTANINVRAYALLEDGTYIYSNPMNFNVFDLAKHLYENQLMNSVDSHNYLYNNILYLVDNKYTEIVFDNDNTLVN